MGKSKTPPPPDYRAMAVEQGTMNKETALQQFLLNNSPQSTPWGARNLVKDDTSPSGYRIEESLTPQEQSNLDASRALQGQLLGVAPGMVDTLKGVLSSGVNTENLPGMVSGVNTSGLNKLNYNIPGAQYGFNRGNVQGNVGFEGLDKVQSPDAVRAAVEKAAYDKWAQRALPTFDRQGKSLDTRIANMGGNTSSPAAVRMRQELAQNQNDAQQQAAMQAVLQGGEEAQRQFGMGMQGRQQGVQETLAQGQFRNQAQQQDFDQLSTLANLWNMSRGQDAGLQQAQVGINNQVTQGGIQNAFNNATLQNAARAAGITELSQLRQMPLNEIMAVLSGTQVNSPNFQAATPTSWAPPPMFEAGVQQHNANLAAANAKNAQGAGPWGALGSIAGSFFGPVGTAVGGAIGSKISDRRLKTNVRRVGSTPGGSTIYEYDLLGVRARGVMADEVPWAAELGPDGIWRVDYSKVH